MHDTDETALAHFLRRIEQGNEHALTVTREMVGEGPGAHATTTLAIQRREMQPEPPAPPIRAESPPRAHTFHDPDSFSAYVRKFGGADTVILADVTNRRVTATLDEHAGEGREIVTLKPELHPLYRPWHGLFGVATPLADFAAHVLQWRSVVLEPDPRQLALALRQITVAEQHTLYRGTGAKGINGVVVSHEIKAGAESVSETVELPDALTLEVPILSCSPEPVRVVVDLTVGVNADRDVVVVCTSADAIVALEAEYRAMTDRLTAHDDAVIGTGRTEYADWSYLSD